MWRGRNPRSAWLVTHRGVTRDQALTDTEAAAHSDLVQLTVDAAWAGITEQQARDRARGIISDHLADIDQTAQQLIDSGGSL